MNEMTSRRFWAKVLTGDGCWEWSGATRNGYGVLQVGTHARPRVEYAHRLAWGAAHGEIADGAYVLHHCDNKLCVRAEHLFIGDHKENMRDGRSKGRWPSGEKWHQIVRGDGWKQTTFKPGHQPWNKGR